MKVLLKEPLRAATRFLWLGGEIVVALLHYLALVFIHCGHPDAATRSLWLQRICRRGLRVFHVNLSSSGLVPAGGLLVCNHLSYIDILVLGATVPCVFVSKCEVKRWPVFGWCASLAGTLFLRRGRRSDVARVNGEMRRALGDGALLALFPEGTTTDGREILPFKSSLLEPAAGHAHALSAAFIHYALADGSVAEEVCYWKDMTLLPHLLNLLGKRRIEARLSFTELRRASSCRKELARQLHSEVVRLKEAFAS